MIDVGGSFEPQMHGWVEPASSGSQDAPIRAGSSRIVSAKYYQGGHFEVKFDGNISYCTPIVDALFTDTRMYGSAVVLNSDSAFVDIWYLDPTTHLEVGYSSYSYIAVIC